MDEFIYNALSSYYNVLEKLGYMSYADMQKLLVLTFYKDFTEEDFRGSISCDDYRLIEQALNCLYGSSCLIPYPIYKKMGKLHLGEATELATRIERIENTKVIKEKEHIQNIPDIGLSISNIEGD